MKSPKTTSAGIWSVFFAIIPAGIVILLLLTLFIPVWSGYVHGVVGGDGEGDLTRHPGRGPGDTLAGLRAESARAGPGVSDGVGYCMPAGQSAGEIMSGDRRGGCLGRVVVYAKSSPNTDNNFK